MHKNNPSCAPLSGRTAQRLPRKLLAALATLGFALTSPAHSAGFTIDTSGTAMTGMWWNQSESGWGTALTHQYGMIFATIYTYDANKNPVWYVASSCPVTADRCSGPLYSVTGGTPASATWNGANLTVSPVGTVSLVFTDTNTGNMSYTVNGVSGSKAIARQVFASGTTAPATDYSGIWWNPGESGWGMAVARQNNMNFATLYTYDASGKPTWYVASSCPMVGNGCSGALYSVTGGSPLTSAWSGGNLTVTDVGTLNLAFTDVNNGSMNFTLKGVSGSKTIAKQVFASPPAAPAAACGSANAPAGMNYSQNGNNISVTTNGCIAVPAAGLCTPASPQATNVNVLSTSTTTSAKIGGLTFNIPGLSSQFESAMASYANIKSCTRNAPANYSSLNVDYNVCFDITSQMAPALEALEASGMVTVSTPITIATQGKSTMRVVSDCESSGADSIYDALTGKVLVKQANGSYLAIN